MENNKLKEKIRKSIKEEIAISNIRKEFDMKTKRNKKIVYAISSMCAMFILCIGIFIGTNTLNDNIQNTLEISEEGILNVDININSLEDVAMISLDADIEIIELDEFPQKFKFMENLSMPEGYELEDSYSIYVRDNIDVDEYNVLHDYVFNYSKDDLNSIKIAFSEIKKPLRDYYIEEGEKISKIGDVELIVYKSEEMYIVEFEFENIYFDIETTGIDENQLVNLLESIISNVAEI